MHIWLNYRPRRIYSGTEHTGYLHDQRIDHSIIVNVPLPGKLVLQSPGLQVPPSESRKAEMEKRRKLDVMIAYLKDFQDACRKYGVKLNMHIGKDMIHCWGAMEFVPEARAVRQEN